jgi:hypothetical protein
MLAREEFNTEDTENTAEHGENNSVVLSVLCVLRV